MPKPHAKTTAYLSAVGTSDVISRAKIVKAIAAFDAELGLMSQQAAKDLAALNAAHAAETDDGLRSQFEEARQKLRAIQRLASEIDQRTTDLLNAFRELDAHTARLRDVATKDADG